MKTPTNVATDLPACLPNCKLFAHAEVFLRPQHLLFPLSAACAAFTALGGSIRFFLFRDPFLTYLSFYFGSRPFLCFHNQFG